jgi:hypothetical protein
MAAEYPDLVDGLIIVAGSVDPELEPDETWFRAPLSTPFLSWILPRSFRVSNEEIYQLKPELERMLPLWKEVHCPVIIWSHPHLIRDAILKMLDRTSGPEGLSAH